MIQTPFPSPGLDPNYVFSQLFPLIAMVAVALSVAVGVRSILRTPVGEALAQRIRHGRGGGPSLTEPGSDRALLEERLGLLQEQVAELAERLDFTERLLAGQRDRSLGHGD